MVSGHVVVCKCSLSQSQTLILHTTTADLGDMVYKCHSSSSSAPLHRCDDLRQTAQFPKVVSQEVVWSHKQLLQQAVSTSSSFQSWDELEETSSEQRLCACHPGNVSRANLLMCATAGRTRRGQRKWLVWRELRFERRHLNGRWGMLGYRESCGELLERNKQQAKGGGRERGG